MKPRMTVEGERRRYFQHTVSMWAIRSNSAVVWRYFFFAADTFLAGDAWARAEAAADLASLLALGSWRTLPALEATLGLVTSFVLVCAIAEAATDFSSLVAVLL
jgi:hypothetical protein